MKAFRSASPETLGVREPESVSLGSASIPSPASTATRSIARPPLDTSPFTGISLSYLDICTVVETPVSAGRGVVLEAVYSPVYWYSRG